jgi:hypothetical protein
MDPLWNFLYSLPNRRYLDFVGCFIIQVQDESGLDPFAIDLPDELADKTYVPRKPITDEVRRPGTRLILGKAGIGKSTIYASLLRQTDESTLSVGLNLHQVGATLPEPDIHAGEASLLTLDLLVPRIFETYWEKTIRSPQQRVKYLPQLRADKQWMELLRWFYRRYPPIHPEIDDYELMAWLRIPPQAEPLRSQISPLDTLRELMRLITWKASPKLFFGSREFLQAYTEVQVLLDGTEQLSPAAVRHLVTDAQSLYDMHLDKFQFELFMDSAWQSQVADMDCVRQGCVSVINLLPWSDSESRKLLRRRIYSFQSGGSTIDPEEMPEYDLGDLLADSGSLRAEARERLESLIIAGAQGIPLHALRLARCVVAVCARCWPEEFLSPLGVYDIERLVDLYQKSAGF